MSIIEAGDYAIEAGCFLTLWGNRCKDGSSSEMLLTVHGEIPITIEVAYGEDEILHTYFQVPACFKSLSIAAQALVIKMLFQRRVGASTPIAPPKSTFITNAHGNSGEISLS